MIKEIKKTIRVLTPKFVIKAYHFIISHLASFIYQNPSKDMIVIGVTGTGGKSTVVNFIADILEESGKKVGATTTYNFRIGDEEFENRIRMTMPGRFKLQGFLSRMKKKGCEVAVIEVTSQGLEQFRHKGINFDIGVFTNISPEHIEAHGGFEKYLKAKQKLFKHLSKKPRKTINGKEIKKTAIVNLDDKRSDKFLEFKADQKYGFTVKGDKKSDYPNLKIVQAKEIKSDYNGVEFQVKDTTISLDLLGEFNIYNSLAAIAVGKSLGVDLDTAKLALEKRELVPGRMEIVNKNPLVCIDQAHTPEAIEKVYKTLTSIKQGNLIVVLGSAGGGRDKWKRPVIGELAQDYGDIIILTNEDPFWEDPESIINDILKGIEKKDNLLKTNKLFKIINRGKAIEKAFEIANKKDIIAITGKGSEPCIVEKGKKIPWKDKEKVKKILEK